MSSYALTSSTVCARCVYRSLRQNAVGSSYKSFRPVASRYLSTERRPHIISQNHRAAPRTVDPARRVLRRYYSSPTAQVGSSASSLPPPLPPASYPQHTHVALNPRYSDSGEVLSMNISPRAAHRLRQLMTKENNPQLCLRVQVESGGCHGFQYLMSLTSTKDLNKEEDTLLVVNSNAEQPSIESQSPENLGVDEPKVVMDQASLELLEGSKIDYTMELIGSQFKIVDNPRATSSCGCGTSFDVKGDDPKAGAWGF